MPTYGSGKLNKVSQKRCFYFDLFLSSGAAAAAASVAIVGGINDCGQMVRRERCFLCALVFVVLGEKQWRCLDRSMTAVTR